MSTRKIGSPAGDIRDAVLRVSKVSEQQKKVVHFKNEDVPGFLRRLDDFENKSLQAKLVVK